MDGIVYDMEGNTVGTQKVSAGIENEFAAVLKGLVVDTLPKLDLSLYPRESQPAGYGRGYFLRVGESQIMFEEGAEPSVKWILALEEGTSKITLTPYWDGWSSGHGVGACELIPSLPKILCGEIPGGVYYWPPRLRTRSEYISCLRAKIARNLEENIELQKKLNEVADTPFHLPS